MSNCNCKKIEKFPKSLQNKLSKAARMNQEAANIVAEAEELFEMTFGEDSNDVPWWRSGNGRTLDEIDYGNDVSEDVAELFNEKLKELKSIN